MTQDEIDGLLGKFRAGTVRAIACTSILGVGLDVQNITHVIHRGYPRDALSYIQEVGRLARDEATTMAWSTVVLPPSTPVVQLDRFGSRLIQLALDDTFHCRRLLIQMFVDGIAEPCTLMEGKVHLCDNCKALSQSKPESNTSLVFPSRLMEEGLGRTSLHFFNTKV
jgi:hypothetical protein